MPRERGLTKDRKFKVGHITRIFERHRQYPNKSKAQNAAARLNGQRYYTRVTKVKGKRGFGHDYVVWKKKKPEWK